MHALKSLLLIAALAGAAVAQNRAPALMVQLDNEKPEPLKIVRADIEARVFGHLAETRMTLTFHNAHNRPLAGDLYFPLPEGATVSGYALNIGDSMVEGVVVEKDRARQVFETEVRKGVDPGLVEWTKGNNFKTRVFPIPANGQRKVMVKYVTELAGAPDAAWRLPLGFAEKIGELNLRVEVVKPAGEPKIVSGGPKDLLFKKWSDVYAAETTLKDAALEGDLVIQLPQVQKQRVLVEKAADGKVYFCLNDFPAAPPTGPASVAGRIVIFWDASGSRGLSDHKAELDVIRSLFAAPGYKTAKVQVELVAFRNAPEPGRVFLVEDGDAGKLIEAIAAIRYDGGTQLGALVPPGNQPRPDFYLLFSDGLSNFGLAAPPGLDAPVYAVSGDASANHAFLHRLAAATGGEYFNLDRLKPADAAGAIGRTGYAFLGAAVDGNEAVVFPTGPQTVGGRLSLAGVLTGKTRSAKVTLNYGMGGKVQHQESFEVSAADAVEGNLLRVFWAQQKLQELLPDPERNERQIVELGKEYGLVTPGTSLMVLENLDQYVQHKIAPPKSLPEMRNKYLALMDAKAAEEKKAEAGKLDRVLALWQERVKWWEQQYKYDKDFKYRPEPAGEPRASRFPSGAPRAAQSQPAGVVDLAVTPPAASPLVRDPGSGLLDTGAAQAADRRYVNLGIAGKPGGADHSGAISGQPAIAIKEWDPKTPYLAALKQAPAERRVETYFVQRRQFGGSPAFFLDCADFFFKAGDRAMGMQVLSNVAELELENAALVRVLAHRLAQLEELDLAAMLFEEALRLRPEEPQSYRDLALVLASRAARDRKGLAGKPAPDSAKDDSPVLAAWARAKVAADYRRSLELLAKVVMNKWDRFDEIELIALVELNRVWAEFSRAFPEPAPTPPLDGRLIKLLDFDCRVVMTWDADMTDMDLHLIEPSGEEAFYSHNRTSIGGLVSRDFTQGYGPEEYLLRRAMHGTYKINTNYFGSSAARLLGPVTVQVDVFTNFGRENQTRKGITLRLTERKETVTIGEVEF